MRRRSKHPKRLSKNTKRRRRSFRRQRGGEVYNTNIKHRSASFRINPYMKTLQRTTVSRDWPTD